jgi:CheY-like chemotaxis protein
MAGLSCQMYLKEKDNMKKVLIVDDSKVLITALQGGLTKYKDHFEAVYAGDGLEAMNLLDEHSVSLVVTDIQMPVMDGLVLLAFIRERYPDIPCIIMSSYGDDELKSQVSPDIIHFIEKPVQVKKLAEMIINALSSKAVGRTGRIAISDLLNLIILGKKTCIFKIIPENGDSGYYYFYQGDLYNAVCGDRQGADAVKAMLDYDKARLVFTKAPATKGVKKVNVDLMQLIRQAKASKLSVKVER